MSLNDPREFDLVLLGATGFVGRLTAQHLAAHAPAELRIGLAGRSAERLAEVSSSLGPNAQDWPLITTDVHDTAAVAHLAERTRVVATTVGPYLRYGLLLVQACAAAGTDYVDLTGETLFVRRSIDTAHQAATASGARIVHSCGFDSVPSDLGVGFTAARAEADGHGSLTDTVLHVRSLRAGISGGTIDSLRQQILETRSDPKLRTLVADPAALVDGGSGGPSSRPTLGTASPVSRDPQTGRWSAPFVMGGFNRQIVLRSSALRGGYGPGFSYREVLDTGTGPVGAARSAAIVAGTTALVGGMWFGPTRTVLDRLLPDPGQGPSERTRRNGRFLFELVAGTAAGPRYRTRFGADLDPGYEGTAVMLGQAALSLATDADLPDRAGVLTPMTAMGDALAARLRSHGFSVSTEQIDETADDSSAGTAQDRAEDQRPGPGR